MAVSTIAFHLTDRCQLDCVHCLRDPAQKPKDLPLSLIDKILAEATLRYKTSHVALTGGEPTQHPEIEGIIDCILYHGCSYRLVSNGKRFEPFLRMLRGSAERIDKLTAINLSLDGADEATHDAIRGQGSFRDVLTAATLCTAYQIPFTIQMVCHKKNAHQIEAMGLLASEIGAKRLSIAMHQPTGTHYDRDLYLSSREWRSLYDRIERLRGALTMPVQTPEGFYRPEPFHICEPFSSRELHVDVEGRLNLCCQHSGVPSSGPRSDIAGDLAQTSLAQAHKNLLGIIHQVQIDRIDTLTHKSGEHEDGGGDEWDYFPCNACLKYFGKPHWDNAESQGPKAQRQRWRGAWDPAKKIQSNDTETLKKRLPLAGEGEP